LETAKEELKETEGTYQEDRLVQETLMLGAETSAAAKELANTALKALDSSYWQDYKPNKLAAIASAANEVGLATQTLEASKANEELAKSTLTTAQQMATEFTSTKYLNDMDLTSLQDQFKERQATMLQATAASKSLVQHIEGLTVPAIDAIEVSQGLAIIKVLEESIFQVKQQKSDLQGTAEKLQQAAKSSKMIADTAEHDADAQQNQILSTQTEIAEITQALLKESKMISLSSSAYEVRATATSSALLDQQNNQTDYNTAEGKLNTADPIFKASQEALTEEIEELKELGNNSTRLSELELEYDNAYKAHEELRNSRNVAKKELDTANFLLANARKEEQSMLEQLLHTKSSNTKLTVIRDTKAGELETEQTDWNNLRTSATQKTAIYTTAHRDTVQNEVEMEFMNGRLEQMETALAEAQVFLAKSTSIQQLHVKATASVASWENAKELKDTEISRMEDTLEMNGNVQSSIEAKSRNPTSSNSCLPCAAGSWADNDAADCVEHKVCTPGEYVEELGTHEDDTQCVKCLAGTTSNATSNEDNLEGCETCYAGKSSVEGGTCVLCDPNTFSGPGAASCELCPAGTTSDNGAEVCKPCPGGHYSGSGQDCQECPEGKYSDQGASECKICPADTYSTGKSPKCIPCSTLNNLLTSDPGQAFCNTCKDGFTPNVNGEKHAECEWDETCPGRVTPTDVDACADDEYFFVRGETYAGENCHPKTELYKDYQDNGCCDSSNTCPCDSFDSFGCGTDASQGTPILTMISDGDCSGGNPKVVEIYAHGEVDFSKYALDVQANLHDNWSDWSDLEKEEPRRISALGGLGIITDKFVYVYNKGSHNHFSTEYPSKMEHSIPFGQTTFNGDDRIAIIDNKSKIIDQYGETGVDGTYTNWYYKDGYAKRKDRSNPNTDGGFSESSWTYFRGDLNNEGICQGGNTLELIQTVGSYKADPNFIATTVDTLDIEFNREDYTVCEGNPTNVVWNGLHDICEVSQAKYDSEDITDCTERYGQVDGRVTPITKTLNNLGAGSETRYFLCTLHPTKGFTTSC
jgi:hypothetical protein